MGVSPSIQQMSPEEQEVKDLESRVANSGTLPILQKAFCNLSGSDKNSVLASTLEECFHCRFFKLESKEYAVPAEFPMLLTELGPTIVSIYFTPQDGQVLWPAFLRGYDKCCMQTSATQSVNLLFMLFHEARKRAQLPSRLKFIENENDKIGGHFSENDICVFLWFCWLMEHNARCPDLCVEKNDASSIELPEINHLVRSAMMICSGSDTGELHRENSNKTSYTNVEISAASVFSWIFATIPGLYHCFPQYVQGVIQRASTSLSVAVQTSPQKVELRSSDAAGLLTSGTAWAIALAIRAPLGGESLMESIMSVSHSSILPNLIYRSSQHGKGLNRFWSQVEGYNGPSLILVSGSLKQDGSDQGFIIGAFTNQGFENRDSFYGSSGALYAVKPLFRSFFPTGRDKSFVYSHQRAIGRVYEARPRPVGIAFGGTQGNERVFIDEDFARITIRHHAVDKTYQPGLLIPGQASLTTEASIFDVEAWGLGGKTAEQGQATYKQREQLFSEQRRKVDLKTFGNWEDSPEKMMMDLVANPHRVQREDR